VLLNLQHACRIWPAISLDEKDCWSGQNIMDLLPLKADGLKARESGGIQRIRTYPGKAVGCRDMSMYLLLEEGLW
jgi:hypothetical protein